MYLYNKEHAIYCMNRKNDTIGPGSNLLLEFTEQMDSRLSTTLKLIGQSLAESQAVFLEYLEVDSIVIAKKTLVLWFQTAFEDNSALFTILFSVALVNGLLQLLAESGTK